MGGGRLYRDNVIITWLCGSATAIVPLGLSHFSSTASSSAKARDDMSNTEIMTSAFLTGR